MKRALVLGFACSVLAAACGGSSGGTGGGTTTTSSACSNINGTWISSSEVDATACGTGSYHESFTYAITQSEGSCDISVLVNGVTLSGMVSGTTVSWTGSYPENTGTTTLTNVDLVVASDDTTLSGTITWSYKSSSTQCTGSTAFTATKSS